MITFTNVVGQPSIPLLSRPYTAEVISSGKAFIFVIHEPCPVEALRHEEFSLFLTRYHIDKIEEWVFARRLDDTEEIKQKKRQLKEELAVMSDRLEGLGFMETASILRSLPDPAYPEEE